MTLLMFVDVRFRPGVQVPEADIREYYEKQLIPEWKKTHTGTAPGFEESKAEVENAIAADIADHALDRWLGQTRTQTQILFRSEVFR
jgi:peptidyl-prolyl cis-trans isomerase SurA